MEKSSNSYSHLDIELSDSFYTSYRKFQFFGKLFGSTSATRFGLRILAKVLPFKTFILANNIAGNYASTIKKIKSIQQKRDENPLSFDSEFGYKDEMQELSVAKYYRNQLLLNDLYEKSESFELYNKVISEVTKLLIDNPSIKKVINFGVSYAHVDSELAKLFPNVSFVGIDRSKMTQHYNQELFGDIKNLSFEAGDIFEYLESSDQQDSVLFHVRTCVLLPKAFMEKLYKKSHDLGVKFILGFEQIGLSRQTNTPYSFSEADQESVVFRIFMLIHNYPGILKNQGYSLEKSELLKTRHADEDYRILFFKGSLTS
jgi:hypothetical protein